MSPALPSLWHEVHTLSHLLTTAKQCNYNPQPLYMYIVSYYLPHAKIISERKELKYEANAGGGIVTCNSLTFFKQIYRVVRGGTEGVEEARKVPHPFPLPKGFKAIHLYDHSIPRLKWV